MSIKTSVFTYRILLFIPAFLICTCNKPEVDPKPIIEILKPETSSVINLPGSLHVEVKVKSEENIEFVRIGIQDSKQNTIAGNRFFYPQEREVVISFEFYLGWISPESQPPFYLKVAVDNGHGLTFAFQDINLNNSLLKSKGFYLFSRPSINLTSIKYYDPEYQVSQFKELNGEYVDATYSVKNDMLFIALSVPGKLFAFKHENSVQKWFQTPEAPYPEYTDLYHDGAYLYAGYANGRIAAVHDETGSQRMATRVFTDSVPVKIGVADNFFIADFEKRISPGNTWSSFYRGTGSQFQTFEAGISVVDFDVSHKEGAIDVIGNREGKGIVARYLFVENMIENEIIISEGMIQHVSELDDWRYLINVNNTLYKITTSGGAKSVYAEFAEDIVDLKYDAIENRVIVAFNDRIEVLAYPDYEQIKVIQLEESAKAIRLRYGY